MSLQLVESFSEFKEFKNIDREVMMGILEDVFRAMILKKYGDDSNFDIIINPDKGDLEIWRNRVIVGDGEVEDFPGNYSDFRVYEDSKPKEEPVEIKKVETKTIAPTNKATLTYKEKKEFDAIDGEIEQLGKQKSAVEAKFLDSSLSGEEINELSIKLQEISNQIDRKEERWFELSSKLEG